jgi:hypothetical protein
MDSLSQLAMPAAIACGKLGLALAILVFFAATFGAVTETWLNMVVNRPRGGYSANATRSVGRGCSNASPTSCCAATAWRSPWHELPQVMFSRALCGHPRLMVSRFMQWTLDVNDVESMAAFWAAAPGYRIEHGDNGEAHL